MIRVLLSKATVKYAAIGEPIAVGRVVDPLARTTEVRFAFDNVTSRLQVGLGVRLRLLLDDEESGPAIPDSAVVDDGGPSDSGRVVRQRHPHAAVSGRLHQNEAAFGRPVWGRERQGCGCFKANGTN